MAWGFYGRNDELRQVQKILSRKRWFFAKMTGRRRIGKTTLIQQAIESTKGLLRANTGLRASRSLIGRR